MKLTDMIVRKPFAVQIFSNLYLEDGGHNWASLIHVAVAHFETMEPGIRKGHNNMAGT